MRRSVPIICCCVLALSSFARAAADVAWTITTADFAEQHARQLTFDDNGARFKSPTGAEQSLAWDQFLQAERDGASTRPGGPLTLHLVGGDRIAGSPVSLEGETLKWKSALAGELSLPMRQFSFIGRGDRQPPRDGAATAPTEDSVTLANGDTVRGIVTTIGGKEVTVQSAGADAPSAVPLESVVAVQFAVAAPAEGDSQRAFRVKLTDGSVLTGSSVKLGGDQLTLALTSGQRVVPASEIVSIEQANGPVAWLSSLPPAESIHTPLFETIRPARMDRTVRGDPIRFGDRTFTRGIGVHSRSVIAWPLDGTYKTFRTQYAIDGELPYANVTVRIRLDDKVVHERADFTAGELSNVVQVPLEGAKRLVLEVDYGKTYDVQDRFNWIEPALLKSAPAPAPTTQP